MITLANNPARILAPVETLNCFDTQSANMGRALTPLQAWNLAIEDPQPLLKLAFRLRDAVSTRFGVKAIGGFSRQSHEAVAVGQRLDFFLVEHTDETALVLTERDRHLDVMTCISTEGARVTITSSVKVHNWFGHVYMLPAGIARGIIVRRMLRRLAKKTGA